MRFTTVDGMASRLQSRPNLRRLLVLLFLGVCQAATGQFDSGAVLGNIKDPPGAIVYSAAPACF